jgi:hypothetical protein
LENLGYSYFFPEKVKEVKVEGVVQPAEVAFSRFPGADRLPVWTPGVTSCAALGRRCAPQFDMFDEWSRHCWLILTYFETGKWTVKIMDGIYIYICIYGIFHMYELVFHSCYPKMALAICSTCSGVTHMCHAWYSHRAIAGWSSFTLW